MKNSNLLVALLGTIPVLFGCSAISIAPAANDGRIQPVMKISHAAKSARDFYELGRHHQAQNHLAEAVDAYRNALQLDGHHVDSHNALGTVYSLQNKFDEATAQFSRALESAPRNASIYNNLGYTYFLKKDYLGATVAFEKAIALDPANARAYNNLGSVHRQTGQVEKARKAFARAEELTAASTRAMALNQARAAGGLAPPNWNLAAKNSEVSIALGAGNHDASSTTLHDPDALMLKVEKLLRNLPSLTARISDAIDWKPVAPGIGQYDGTTLFLKLTRQMAARAMPADKPLSGDEAIILEPVSAAMEALERDVQRGLSGIYATTNSGNRSQS